MTMTVERVAAPFNGAATRSTVIVISGFLPALIA